MSAYYNEFDRNAASWLRELIRRGLIADGEVDERSIVEVDPSDLRGFTQCHFFAGIGVWSYSLRSAGWPDDRPVWTGSCPCQPFSAAGAGKEFADERHLWPAFFRLIRERRPESVIGEQVASRDALAWLDHVCADLEGEGYAVGAVDTCAAGFGAPHIRQRLYWVADAASAGANGGQRIEGCQRDARRPESAGCGTVSYMADAASSGRADGSPLAGSDGARAQQAGIWTESCADGEPVGIVGNAFDARSQGRQRPGDVELHGGTGAHGPTATAGFWRDAEWLPCRDGKARPVEPGVKPLVDGATARVVRLRAYGNAICAPQATEVIRAYMDIAA